MEAPSQQPNIAFNVTAVNPTITGANSRITAPVLKMLDIMLMGCHLRQNMRSEQKFKDRMNPLEKFDNVEILCNNLGNMMLFVQFKFVVKGFSILHSAPASLSGAISYLANFWRSCQMGLPITEHVD